jgi:HK97 family phage major capsid protein
VWLYPAQVMSRLPITRMQMGGRVQHIPKLTSQVTIAYAAENASLVASQPQFAQLSFTARKQYAFIQLPNELIRDSAPAADQVIFQHAQTRMAVDRDTQMLFGNGQAGAPVGLINATNVGSYTLASDVGNGISPAYSDFVSLINLVRQINNSTNVPVGQTDCTGVVGAVRVEQTVAALKDTNNRPLWAYGLNQIGRVPAPGWLGVPNWVLTNIVPTNVTKGSSNVTSYLIAGDWQYLVYMMRQDVEFLATNVGGTAFQNDQTWIRLISRYDVGVIHPEAFTVAGGVLV